MKLKIFNVKYDLDGSYGFNHYSKGRTRQELTASLPEELELVLPQHIIEEGVKDESFGGRDQRELWIQEEIEDNQKWLVKGFQYIWTGMTFTFLQSPHNSTVFNEINSR